MGKYKLEDKQFGTIILYTRAGMHSLSARWENGQLRLNVPEGASVEWIFKTLNPMRERIAALNKHIITYSIGQVIKCYKHKITIKTHNGRINQFGYGGTNSELYVTAHIEADFTNPTINKTLSSCISELARQRAEKTLIPRAIEIAKKVGKRPSNFVIGRGLRKLGHCTRSREIQLSYNLMFLPEHLIDFVIYHELAHLTHLNHSGAFHTLCNSYCNGNENALASELKNFKFPIIR